MAKQRHLIKRQILEMKVPQASQNQRFYSEMSRIHHQQILPFLDKWCTELSAPDRIHRIESLELDIGHVDIHNLEEDLLRKLSKVLPEALAKQIRSQERQSNQQKKNIKETSQLELFTLFVRTGSLPWWVDTSQSHLLDRVLNNLIQNAPDSLAWLMGEIAREKQPLRRIVLCYDDKMLSSLCLILAPLLESSITQFAGKLITLLQKSRAMAGTKQTQLRNMVWFGMLGTASLKGRQLREPSVFWKEVFLQTALQSGITYESLVTGLGSSIQKETTAVHSQFRDIIETVFKELPGETQEKIETVFEELPGETQEKERLLHILKQLQHSESPLSFLCKALYPVANQLPDLLQAQLLSVLKGSDNTVAESKKVKEIVQMLYRAIKQHVLSETLLRQLHGEVQKLQANGLPSEALSELTDLFKDTSGDALIFQAQDEEPTIDLRFSDADELYINNSGLVVLWPFLGNFFKHIGLVEEKRFKDRASVHRAVGLLQYLVTEDPFPAEYLLPLNKVLCAMDLSEVFDFQVPVNSKEAQECSSLLTAVIEHAPILKNMSLSGFRGSFLIRKGVLTARDGAWLLRVEKESYDLVLERFPWSFEWVKLPWMEVPLRIEW